MDALRGATINVGQLPNGYWRGEVTVRIPGLSDEHASGDLFHDAGEALDWARMTVEEIVGRVALAGLPPLTSRFGPTMTGPLPLDWDHTIPLGGGDKAQG